MKTIATFFLAGIALLSCHSGNNFTNKSIPDDSSSTSAIKDVSQGEAGSNDVASVIKVTLTGGDNAGTYTASSKETTCSIGLAGDKSFGNQYSIDAKNDKEFSSLQLVATDYDEAKAGTSNFMVTVGFGKIMTSKSYTIDGTNADKPKGSGKLKLSESGKTKTVEIDGTTADGVHITATITCKSVMTSNGVE